MGNVFNSNLQEYVSSLSIYYVDSIENLSNSKVPTMCLRMTFKLKYSWKSNFIYNSIYALILEYKILMSIRHVLQLHHDDGGEQCGLDCGGAQLSPQV